MRFFSAPNRAAASSRTISIPISVTFLVVALALWLRAEWRANRFRNAPRLWMFVGTNLLAVSFLVCNPVKAYLAFTFSHAVEYMDFVWAFQRRRYAREITPRPMLQRVLYHPATAYLGFTFILAGLFLYLKYWGKYIAPDFARPMLAGFKTSHWLLYWGIYQSLVHFYFDGFLWKMRSKTVRESI